MALTPEQRLSLIARYRAEPLRGAVVSMTPCGVADADDLIRMRNAERARFALNQTQALTLESQSAFLRTYLARTDDLYWMIRDPHGRVVGANALYSIDPNGRAAEKGRLVVDEQLGLTGPFALESDLLLLGFAFDVLELEQVVTIVRPENSKMLSMNARFGFQRCGEREVRGVDYQEFSLDRARFDRGPLEAVVSHWRQRFERATAKRSVLEHA